MYIAAKHKKIFFKKMLGNVKCHDENKAEELPGDYFRLRGQ